MCVHNRIHRNKTIGMVLKPLTEAMGEASLPIDGLCHPADIKTIGQL